MPSSRADHEDRIAQLYELYSSRIAAYALRRAPSSEAADVVSETFLVAWRRSESVPPEPDTLPWLYGVSRRVLANQRRSTRRRSRLRERLSQEFTEHRQSPSSIEVTEDFQRVAHALRQLSHDDAEVLRLTAWEAMTPTEIAVAMDIEPSAARQRIHRARKRLRRRLASDGFDRNADTQLAQSKVVAASPQRLTKALAPHGPEEAWRS